MAGLGQRLPGGRIRCAAVGSGGRGTCCGRRAVPRDGRRRRGRSKHPSRRAARPRRPQRGTPSAVAAPRTVPCRPPCRPMAAPRRAPPRPRAMAPLRPGHPQKFCGTQNLPAWAISHFALPTWAISHFPSSHPPLRPIPSPPTIPRRQRRPTSKHPPGDGGREWTSRSKKRLENWPARQWN